MTVTQDQLKELNVKPGDIILFSGTDWSSTLIRFVTDSDWSHVGLVTECKNILCLFEASGPNPALSLKKALAGKVQLQPLDESLNNYKGGIAIRHIHTPLSEPQLCTLDYTVRRYIGLPYERSIGELIKSAVDAPKWWKKISLIGKPLSKLFRNKENNTSLFCSELVALTYRNLGLKLSPIPVNEYTPEDLSSTSIYSPFRGFKTFSKEILLVDMQY